MPQYFFHIDGARRYLDTDGVELADLAAARMRARHAEAAERRARQARDRLSLAAAGRANGELESLPV